MLVEMTFGLIHVNNSLPEETKNCKTLFLCTIIGKLQSLHVLLLSAVRGATFYIIQRVVVIALLNIQVSLKI